MPAGFNGSFLSSGSSNQYRQGSNAGRMARTGGGGGGQLDLAPPGTPVVSLERLKEWWLERCDEFIVAKFSVVIPLWCSVHGISFLEALAEITDDGLTTTKASLRHDISAEGLILYRVLARPVRRLSPRVSRFHCWITFCSRFQVGKEAAQRVMAEMDNGTGLAIDRSEAQHWWEQYSDDMGCACLLISMAVLLLGNSRPPTDKSDTVHSAFDAAWRNADTDFSNDISQDEVPAFLQGLLTPLIGQVISAQTRPSIGQHRPK